MINWLPRQSHIKVIKVTKATKVRKCIITYKFNLPGPPREPMRDYRAARIEKTVIVKASESAKIQTKSKSSQTRIKPNRAEAQIQPKPSRKQAESQPEIKPKANRILAEARLAQSAVGQGWSQLGSLAAPAPSMRWKEARSRPAGCPGCIPVAP